MSPLDAGEGMRKTKCDYEGYDVLGSGGGNIGKVGCLFKDEDNQSEYVEVKGGLVERFLGHGYYILPMELCTVDEGQQTIRASVDEDTVKHSPYLDSSLDLDRSHATGVRKYYGL